MASAVDDHVRSLYCQQRDRLEKDVTRLKTELKDCRLQRDLVMDRLKVVTQTAELELQRLTEALEGERGLREQDSATADTELREAERAVHAANTSLEAAERKHKDEEDRLSRKIGSLSDDLLEAEGRIAAMSQREAGLNRKLQAALEAAEEANTRACKLEAVVHAPSKPPTPVDDSHALHAQIAELQAEVGLLQCTAAEADRKARKVKEMQAAVEVLTAKLDYTRQEIADRDEALSDLTARLQTVSRQRDDALTKARAATEAEAAVRQRVPSVAVAAPAVGEAAAAPEPATRRPPPPPAIQDAGEPEQSHCCVVM